MQAEGIPVTDRDGSRRWLALARLVPIDQVPGLGGALYPITFIALLLITNVYYRRAGLYALLGARWLEETDPVVIPRSVECSLTLSPPEQNPRASTT